MAANQHPTYTAYTVIKREGHDDWWCAIGAAFEHADQSGFNVVLQALPVDGKIVLRPHKAQNDEAKQPPAHETPRRDANPC